MKVTQSASAVLMVRPRSFGYDTQTAATNAFQKRIHTRKDIIQKQANREFNAMVDSLRERLIQVIVAEDNNVKLPKPNAVFPNNWFSLWPDGQVFLYPMATESRRVERNSGVLDELGHFFKIKRINDLAATEATGQFLESTGVMIFDHPHKVVYGCISARCNAKLFRSHALQLGYKPVIFHGYYYPGQAIYHTNIALSIQSTTAVIYADAITNETERTVVLASLTENGHTVVPITRSQMEAYCGNVLELRNSEGKLYLAMSQTAFDGFTNEQRSILSRDKELLPFEVTTIETIGGGSVRCMLAEIFLPRLP